MLSLVGLAVSAEAIALLKGNASAGVPHWGCGLLGQLPGISPAGIADGNAQKMIDGLKVTSSFGKTTYWNWNLAPESTTAGAQYLTKDFIFMPEQWGMDVPESQNVRTAGVSPFSDGNGNRCPATMANIFLGGNEPDIYGSCMGNMMGKCTAPCTDAEVQSGCPVAKLDGPPADPLPNGHCDCWDESHATGVGFWPQGNCATYQPLPTLFSDIECVGEIMTKWRSMAKLISSKGYQYLSTPLVAVSIDWLRAFIKEACNGCSDVSCGCPSHIGWHFYASDCQPISLGGYDDFQSKLDASKILMEDYPHLLGAIVNEVGMLNCAGGGDVICIPNGPDQKYPAIDQPDHSCPITDELPNGLGTFIDELMNRVIAAKTNDGRSVVTSFSWFNENMDGGTYNLRLFNDDGTVNSVGEAYISACQRWAASVASVQSVDI